MAVPFDDSLPPVMIYRTLFPGKSGACHAAAIRTFDSMSPIEIRIGNGRVLVGRYSMVPASYGSDARTREALRQIFADSATIAQLRSKWSRLGLEHGHTQHLTPPELRHTLERAVESHRLALLWIAPPSNTPPVIPAGCAPAPPPPTPPALPGMPAKPAVKPPIGSMNAGEKIWNAFERSFLYLASDAVEGVAALKQAISDLTPAQKIIIAATLVFLASPPGEVLAGAMVAYAWFLVGFEGAKSAMNMVAATYEAATATSDAEIEVAARLYANALEHLGAGIIGWLTRGRLKEAGGVSRGAKLADEEPVFLVQLNQKSSTPISGLAISRPPSTLPVKESVLSEVKETVVSIRHDGWFNEVARNATRNPDSDKLILGRFSKSGTSYQNVASHYKGTYFKVESWRSVTQNLSQDEIWRINETFLTQQIKQGKQILLSSDPAKAIYGSYFEREVLFLEDLGYLFRQQNQWMWEAVR